MSQYSRLKILNTINETELVPVFYHPDAHVATSVIEVCAAGSKLFSKESIDAAIFEASTEKVKQVLG